MNSTIHNLSTVLFLAAVGLANASSDTTYTLQEFLLNVKNSTIEAEKVLNQKIEDIQNSSGFTVLRAERGIWVKYTGNPFRPISEILALPADIDWFQRLTVKNNLIYLSVAAYPVSRKTMEDSASFGAFRAGPTPKGIMLIDLGKKSCTVIPYLPVDQKCKIELRKKYPEMAINLPDTIMTYFQNYFWRGNELLSGSSGQLISIDFGKRMAGILEYDDGLELNRSAVTVHEGILWVSVDEGGASGSWLVRDAGGVDVEIRIPGHPYANINAFAAKGTRLFGSSLAGLLEINVKKKHFTCFKLSETDKENSIYDLQCIDGILMAESENGLIIMDADKKIATKILFADRSVSNDIYSFGTFEDEHYIGSKSGLYRVKKRNFRQ